MNKLLAWCPVAISRTLWDSCLVDWQEKQVFVRIKAQFLTTLGKNEHFFRNFQSAKNQRKENFHHKNTLRFQIGAQLPYAWSTPAMKTSFSVKTRLSDWKTGVLGKLAAVRIFFSQIPIIIRKQYGIIRPHSSNLCSSEALFRGTRVAKSPISSKSSSLRISICFAKKTWRRNFFGNFFP